MTERKSEWKETVVLTNSISNILLLQILPMTLSTHFSGTTSDVEVRALKHKLQQVRALKHKLHWLHGKCTSA